MFSLIRIMNNQQLYMKQTKETETKISYIYNILSWLSVESAYLDCNNSDD